ncbi:MAG TPA: HD domain-containing phosphohydrolase [Anaerolineales bacterium]|nr:HD domain-containing phosphohydrolase [Anaerolineales bacterium]
MNLSSAEQTLEAILQTFTDTSFVLTPGGVILDYKSNHHSLAFAFSDSIQNKEIRDVFPSNLADQLQDALRTVERTGNVVPLEYLWQISNREYWFDARLIPVSDSEIMLIARDITACREIEVKMKRQVQQLSILRSIDLAIASGLDLNLLLSMLLERVTALMHVDAATVLLLNPSSNLLEFASGKGFHSNILQHTHLKIGEGCAGRVALERKMISIPDLRVNQMEFDRSPLFQQENFVTYWGVPLMAKGRVLGVLEMFHRSALKPDTDLQNFLIMVAGQAAIAIDSSKMFSELQRSNVELSLAYDATIEGLSRALDLRDKETKEHTFRVTAITVKLAARLGIEQSELIHVRRGAILHDIGKVAIPDQILFKPGPLAEEEWEIMRQHPRIAVELLSPVSYLEPALAIPHWHHEKWNGSGYPDGLQRENIPFAARLFALADVYDALISNRPYRGAWPKQQAIRYIAGEAGKHFDPKIVPEFLDLIQGNGF